MKGTLLSTTGGLKTYVVVFDEGDEVASGLLRFAQENDLTAAHFTALGAFRDVTLGFFDLDRREYHHNRLGEQVEVIALVGNVAPKEGGELKVHAHVVVGKRDGSAWGGHLIEAHVRPTLEVTLVESPGHLRRTYDEKTGLALLSV